MRERDFPVPDWQGKISDDPAHERIAAVLVMDIARAADWARAMLGHVTNVRDGVEPHWEMAMNAYILKVGQTQTEIVPVYDETNEPDVLVKTDDLHSALQAWCAQLPKSPE